MEQQSTCEFSKERTKNSNQTTKQNPLDIEEKIIMNLNNEQKMYAPLNSWNIEEPPSKKVN